jgi:hypothetical protein
MSSNILKNECEKYQSPLHKGHFTNATLHMTLYKGHSTNAIQQRAAHKGRFTKAYPKSQTKKVTS